MARARPSEVQKGRKRVTRAVGAKSARAAAPAGITPAEAQFVEEVAVFYEGLGLPRMAGRILGWLMMCDPSHQSLSELGEVLQASKGSISTMTRLLLQLGVIQRVSVPGDRRDFVAIPPGSLTKMFSQQAQRVTAIRQLAQRGLDVMKGTKPERQERLREMHDLYAFWEREMPLLLARWEKESKRSRSN